jgi:hypothetical protein
MAATLNKLNTMRPQKRVRIQTTLLNIVWAINEVTDDDQLVVATVAHMINSGRARLTGTFKNTRLIIG